MWIFLPSFWGHVGTLLALELVVIWDCVQTRCSCVSDHLLSAARPWSDNSPFSKAAFHVQFLDHWMSFLEKLNMSFGSGLLLRLVKTHLTTFRSFRMCKLQQSSCSMCRRNWHHSIRGTVVEPHIPISHAKRVLQSTVAIFITSHVLDCFAGFLRFSIFGTALLYKANQESCYVTLQVATVTFEDRVNLLLCPFPKLLPFRFCRQY